MSPSIRCTAFAAICVLVAVTVCAETPDQKDEAAERQVSHPAETTAAAASAPRDLVVKDLKAGKGLPVMAGAWARVHYTGWLYDPTAPDGKGKKFDSSVDSGEAFVFQLGKQKVIRGWDLGMVGMRPGSQRRFVIPPTLAYGARGAGRLIPPHATLVFDVELIDYLPALPEAHPAPVN